MRPIKKPSGPVEQRETGRQQVFDAIRSADQTARIDISRRTGLSPATVTAITSELMTAGLIEQTTSALPPPGRRGRPRVDLRVRGEAHLIAGLKVSRHFISVFICDFRGNELSNHEAPLTNGRMPVEALCTKIKEALTHSCQKADLSIDALSAIGVGIAGMVDALRGFIYWSSSIEERNIEFVELLSKHLTCPVFIDNDANLVAKAEQLFGVGRGSDNCIVLTLEHGVGMGIILDGKIYRGSRGCGAEFGHTKVQFEGALCQCGQRGCLEAYVGDYALLREANTARGGSEYKTLSQLFSAAERADHVAVSVLQRAQRMFAMGLANVINIFDPDKIILAGARLSFAHLFSDALIAETRKCVMQVDTPLPEIEIHDWGDLMWAKGAAAYAIEEISTLKIRQLTGGQT